MTLTDLLRMTWCNSQHLYWQFPSLWCLNPQVFSPNNLPSLSKLNIRGNPLDQISGDDLLKLFGGFTQLQELEVLCYSLHSFDISACVLFKKSAMFHWIGSYAYNTALMSHWHAQDNMSASREVAYCGTCTYSVAYGGFSHFVLSRFLTRITIIKFDLANSFYRLTFLALWETAQSPFLSLSLIYLC